MPKRGGRHAGRYAIVCTSVLRVTRKILLLGTYNFPVEDGAGALAGVSPGDTQSSAHRS